VLGALISLLLAACGVQGPPRPPRVEQPQPIADLAVAQVGPTLELHFTLPQLATDGERLTRPLEIEIFRAAMYVGQPHAPEFPAQPWVTLTPDDINRFRQERRLAYVVRFSQEELQRSQGTALAFTLRSLTRGFRRRPVHSEFSNVVQAMLLDVSVPVEDLQARVTEEALVLDWTPPRRSLTGRDSSNIAGYRVYESTTGAPGSFQMRAEVVSPPYAQRTFSFDRTYFFKIRTFSRIGSWVGESEDSNVVAVTPRDVFPPATPTALTAAYAAGMVELLWTPNTEADLAGYNLYRREEGKPRQRLNNDLLLTPIFRDPTVQPKHRYWYAVTAIDLANNESSPSSEVSVETD